MKKRLIVIMFGGLIVAAIPPFIYWLAGHSFHRCNDLAFTTLLSFPLAFVGGAIANGFYDDLK